MKTKKETKAVTERTPDNANIVFLLTDEAVTQEFVRLWNQSKGNEGKNCHLNEFLLAIKTLLAYYPRQFGVAQIKYVCKTHLIEDPERYYPLWISIFVKHGRLRVLPSCYDDGDILEKV